MVHENRLPLAAALHDLSSFGRCALTVIIPTLSAMGVQTCPVPTALLSTHTGGFEGFVFEETTDFMLGALRHFRELNLKFDAVYSGFFGNVRQTDIVGLYFDRYSDAIKLADPVLGDDGKLYSTVTGELVEGMRRLCQKADIITPNVTEAAFLLGEEPNPDPGAPRIDSWLERLSGGKRSVVITGVHSNGVSNEGFDAATGERFTVSSPLCVEKYPGTGDIFASVLLGGLLNGLSLREASRKAAEFTYYCIRSTAAEPEKRRNGVALEACLNKLME